MIRDAIGAATLFGLLWAALAFSAALEPCPAGESCYWLEGTSFQRASDILNP